MTGGVASKWSVVVTELVPPRPSVAVTVRVLSAHSGAVNNRLKLKLGLTPQLEQMGWGGPPLRHQTQGQAGETQEQGLGWEPVNSLCNHVHTIGVCQCKKEKCRRITENLTRRGG
jgi:hypothetical protein